MIYELHAFSVNLKPSLKPKPEKKNKYLPHRQNDSEHSNHRTLIVSGILSISLHSDNGSVESFTPEFLLPVKVKDCNIYSEIHL